MRRRRRQLLEHPLPRNASEALELCDLCMDYALQSRRYELDSLLAGGNYYVTLTLRFASAALEDFIADACDYYSVQTSRTCPRYMGHALLHNSGGVTVCAMYFALPGDPEQMYTLLPVSDDDE